MTWLEDRKILVPVDFSEFSLKAVDTALQLATSAAEVTVLHAIEALPVMSPGAVYVPNIDEQQANTARQSLEKQFADPKYDGMKLETVVDDPPHGITDFANQHDIGLIVIHSHGHTGLKRLFVGSVAERVVRLAHCPVLVLRD